MATFCHIPCVHGVYTSLVYNVIFIVHKLILYCFVIHIVLIIYIILFVIINIIYYNPLYMLYRYSTPVKHIVSFTIFPTRIISCNNHLFITLTIFVIFFHFLLSLYHMSDFKSANVKT